MNKTIRTLLLFFAISFLIWVTPFLIRILFMDSIIISHSKPNQKMSLDIVSVITEHLNNNNKLSAFYLIFTNNLKVCITNILGGVLLGIGTLINLFINGFYTADVLSNIHSNGTSWNVIIEHTIPHSFEMIGVWFSGALGFFIAKTIFDIMLKNKYPTLIFYKTIASSTLIIVIIIFIAAYIESFISIS